MFDRVRCCQEHLCPEAEGKDRLSVWSSASQGRWTVPPRAHSPVSGDMSVVTAGGGELLASRGAATILQHPEKPPMKSRPARNVNRPSVRTPMCGQQQQPADPSRDGSWKRPQEPGDLENSGVTPAHQQRRNVWKAT